MGEELPSSIYCPSGVKTQQSCQVVVASSDFLSYGKYYHGIERCAPFVVKFSVESESLVVVEFHDVV